MVISHIIYQQLMILTYCISYVFFVAIIFYFQLQFLQILNVNWASMRLPSFIITQSIGYFLCPILFILFCNSLLC